MCEWLVNKIACKLVKDKAINDEEIEVYKFGIEVTLLKILHVFSYFAIAIWMKRIVEYIVIFVVFYLYRRNVGGYHAKTRIGCYFFSCSMILISLLSVKKKIPPIGMALVVLCDLVVLWRLAPVQNENRKLDCEEIAYLKKRLIRVIALFIFSYIVTWALKSWELIWLYTIGVTLATFLAIMGKINMYFKNLN